MSIKSAIDAKSGVVSKNIEDAINNLEIGKGPGVFSMHIDKDGDNNYVTSCTYRALETAILDGSLVSCPYQHDDVTSVLYVDLLGPRGSVFRLVLKDLSGTLELPEFTASDPDEQMIGYTE